MNDDKLLRRDYSVLLFVVKYLPIIVHVIILLNILEYFLGLNGITNMLYPFIGHSVVFDLVLLFFSYKFRFCLWHHILVYDMLVNILLEWVVVNFPIPVVVNNIMSLSVVIFIVSVISAMLDRFLFHCKHE